MPAKLSVNLNAIAMLRNRRDLPWPSVTGLGHIALAAGAHGLTVHPRPDERHIRFSDLPELRALIDDEFPAAEFNIEGYPTEDFLALVEAIQPNQVTLVPDDPAQATSDHGWNFAADAALLVPIARRLKKGGMRVSVFCDADAEMARLAGETAANAATVSPAADTADGRCDLTVANLPALMQRIPSLAEVSIGHGLIADALEFGMAGTIKRFLFACGW